MFSNGPSLNGSSACGTSETRTTEPFFYGYLQGIQPGALI